MAHSPEELLRVASKKIRQLETSVTNAQQLSRTLAGVVATMHDMISDAVSATDGNHEDRAIILEKDRFAAVAGQRVELRPQDNGDIAVLTYDPEEGQKLAQLHALAEDNEEEAVNDGAE